MPNFSRVVNFRSRRGSLSAQSIAKKLSKPKTSEERFDLCNFSILCQGADKLGQFKVPFIFPLDHPISTIQNFVGPFCICIQTESIFQRFFHLAPICQFFNSMLGCIQVRTIHKYHSFFPKTDPFSTIQKFVGSFLYVYKRSLFSEVNF